MASPWRPSPQNPKSHPVNSKRKIPSTVDDDADLDHGPSAPPPPLTQTGLLQGSQLLTPGSRHRIAMGVDAAEKKQEVPFPVYAKFLCGGMAGVCASFTLHPMDFMKTRMQMSGSGGSQKYHSTADAIASIARKEGISAFYNGGTGSIGRQVIYTTTRLGVYTSLLGQVTKDGQVPNFGTKALIGMFSGLFAGFFATPMDLCLIRMIADGAKPPEQQFKYHNIIHALYRVAKDEGGLKGLYRGAVPTTIRAVVVNGAVLATYSQAKELLTRLGQAEGLLLQTNASIISGFVTAVVSLPIDIVKTRAQAQKGKATVVGIFVGILKGEGPFAFWKGFVPYFARLAPVTILTFVFVEKITYWYNIYILGNEHPKSNL